MEDRTRYTDEVLNMTHDEFVKAWNNGEIQTFLLEELEMDMNTLPSVIEDNHRKTIEFIQNL
jgi:hypothetical protein